MGWVGYRTSELVGSKFTGLEDHDWDRIWTLAVVTAAKTNSQSKGAHGGKHLTLRKEKLLFALELLLDTRPEWLWWLWVSVKLCDILNKGFRPCNWSVYVNNSLVLGWEREGSKDSGQLDFCFDQDAIPNWEELWFWLSNNTVGCAEWCTQEIARGCLLRSQMKVVT